MSHRRTCGSFGGTLIKFFKKQKAIAKKQLLMIKTAYRQLKDIVPVLTSFNLSVNTFAWSSKYTSFYLGASWDRLLHFLIKFCTAKNKFSGKILTVPPKGTAYFVVYRLVRKFFFHFFSTRMLLEVFCFGFHWKKKFYSTHVKEIKKFGRLM